MAIRVDATSALLLCDLQNDFLAPDGAYGRAGAGSPELAALPARVRPVVVAARAAAVPIISSQFTLMPVRGRGPLIAEHLASRRPFLGAGDFEPGAWGHQLLEELAPADVVVQKVAYSAFHASPLEHVLRNLGTRSLIVSGILTNGGVASTVRAAHVLGYEIHLVADGCADMRPELHELALRSLAAGVCELTDCAEIIRAFDAYAAQTAAQP